jgi:hypothetical protein
MPLFDKASFHLVLTNKAAFLTIEQHHPGAKISIPNKYETAPIKTVTTSDVHRSIKIDGRMYCKPSTHITIKQTPLIAIPLRCAGIKVFSNVMGIIYLFALFQY